ncbi:S-fimbrial adhesin protein SfaS precursor [compost metagenome]
MFYGLSGISRALVIAGIFQVAFPVAAAKLQITGTIKAAPCVVDGANSNIQVNLGDNISAAILGRAGSGSEWIEFPLTLKNCPTTTTSATATFSGSEAEEGADLYKSVGTSRRVQIELQSQSGANLGNNKSMAQLVNPLTHEATFNLRARAYSVNGGATPGSIDGVLQIAFVYE